MAHRITTNQRAAVGDYRPYITGHVHPSICKSPQKRSILQDLVSKSCCAKDFFIDSQYSIAAGDCLFLYKCGKRIRKPPPVRTIVLPSSSCVTKAHTRRPFSRSPADKLYDSVCSHTQMVNPYSFSSNRELIRGALKCVVRYQCHYDTKKCSPNKTQQALEWLRGIIHNIFDAISFGGLFSVI